MTNQNDEITNYAYNELNRLIEIHNSDSQLTNYSYNDVGALEQITYPNDTVTEYTYNNRNQLTSLINKDSSQAVLSSYAYTYDNAGNRTQMTEVRNQTTEITDYTYDNTYQLTNEIRTGAEPYSISYSYDDAGNRIQKTENRGQTTETTYTYNNGNQLVSLSSLLSTLSFSYDGNGNLISETDGTNTTTYGRDYENRLVTINNPQYTINNVYDALGKRVRVTENSTTTKYLYDGGLPIIEKDSTDTTIATYTRGLSYGGGIGGIVNAKRGENNYYYHYNGIGGVTGLTDETSTVIATYNYDSYGNTLSSTGSVPNPYGFSTKEFSANSGLMYFGARYYNPTTGRWLSQDPLGMVNGPNLYAYCGNNAANMVDPWGMVAMRPIYPMPDINTIIREALAATKCSRDEFRRIQFALTDLVRGKDAYTGLKSDFLVGLELITRRYNPDPRIMNCQDWYDAVMEMLKGLHLQYWVYRPGYWIGPFRPFHIYVIITNEQGRQYILDPWIRGDEIIEVK